MTMSAESDATPSKGPRVVVSILNWNNAPATINCVHSLLASAASASEMRVTVLDNGSDADDWLALSQALGHENVHLIRLEHNLGFAGGHNVVMRQAIDAGIEYVWLLNNDTTIPEGALQTLMRFMDDDQNCGAASPVIYALHDHSVIDFCGAFHDWRNLKKIIPRGIDESRKLEFEKPGDMVLYGTALMLRTAALKESGLLNEDYFAYYEDDDISRRMSSAGWMSRMCFDASIFHRKTPNSFVERPEYYFYLMSRNDLFFGGGVDRGGFRTKTNRFRLVCRSLIRASRLRSRGMLKKSEACLLGIHHGLTQRGGPPKLDAIPPGWMVFISRYVPKVFLKYLS